MKRKYIICVLMLLLSFIFIDSSIVPTYADTSFSTTTYSPTLDENNVVSDYLNLENITYFSVLNNSIYYTTDSTSINCYSLDTKTVTTIDYEFTNIDYITSALGYLFVSDNHSLLAFKNNMCLLSAFPYTAPSNYDCISFYEDGEDLYIAFIKDDNLYFNQYRDSNTHNMLILLNDREFLGASYDNIFNDVSLITNSTDNVYIVSSVSGSNTFTIVTINGNLITYKTQQGNAENAFNTLNNKQISYINYNNLDLLITLTSERLKVYDVTNEIYFGQDIIYRNLGLDSYITGQLASPQFMDIDKDKIYISDKYGTSKNIQSFIITDTGIKSEKTIVSSVSNDIGRFYNADDILYKDANTMYVADTKNNRIQLFNDTKVTVLDELHSTYSNTSPRSLMLDEFYNLYFTINIDVDKTSIIKYDETNLSTIKEFDGNISDTTITYNNVIYAIDSTLDKVIKINDDKSASVIYDNLGDITDKAKIEYITYIDALLVYDNNTFTLLDTLGNKKAEKAIANINDYTVDHAGNIYLMTDSALYSIKVTENYTFDVSSTPFAYGGNFSCYSVVSLNPSTSTLYFFNKDRQCVESFKSNTILDINIPAPVDAFNIDAITNIDQVKPAKIISDTLIYEYPYNLGNVFNNDYSVTNILVIGEHQDYYYILFNNNDTLNSGYVKKDRVSIQSITYVEKEVITTSHKVDIYKYPTLLKHNGSIYTIDSMSIRENIVTSATFPISIDGMQFYIYKYDNKIGFVYSADVILSSSHIGYLPVWNASIHIIDKTDSVSVYESDSLDSEVLDTLQNEKRIFIDMDSFDEDSEFTKVTYIDNDEEIHSGYIKTENIKLDGVDSNTIMLFIIIGVTIVIFIVLIITFYQIKKKRKIYN